MIDEINKIWIALLTISGYLASAQLVSDFRLLCGSFLDSQLFIIFTLYGIVYNKIQDVYISLLIALGYAYLRFTLVNEEEIKECPHPNTIDFPK